MSLSCSAYNAGNLYSSLHYKQWGWMKFEVVSMQFLHLLAPVLWIASFVLWYIVSEVYCYSNFEYDFGCLSALGLSIVQCALAAYYYHYKLLEDESNTPSYLALPS